MKNKIAAEFRHKRLISLLQILSAFTGTLLLALVGYYFSQVSDKGIIFQLIVFTSTIGLFLLMFLNESIREIEDQFGWDNN
ncbi:hypothetical protein HY989_03165 [Candidatus Micrarchaeota archaeon]|nr:hypothetical protein [Candidatus Micrarchaeota archaeon]